MLYSPAVMAKPGAVELCEQKQDLQDFCGDCQLSDYISHQVFTYMFFVLGEQRDFFCF